MKRGSDKKFIKVKVIPEADEENIIEKDDRIIIKVKEQPEEGRANKRVKQLISSLFPEQNPELIKGLQSQNKIFKLHEK